MLQRSVANEHHQFWSDGQSVLNGVLFNHTFIHGPQQLTDIYLLGLAVKNEGCFVTLGKRIT